MQSWPEGRNWLGKCAQATGMTASLRILSSKADSNTKKKLLGKLHKEWTEAGVSASRVTTLRHLQEKSYQTTSETETGGASQYPSSLPSSSVLHPMTRKPIELSHDLEGHLNSLIAPRGDEEPSRGAMSEDTQVYPMRKSFSSEKPDARVISPPPSHLL